MPCLHYNCHLGIACYTVGDKIHIVQLLFENSASKCTEVIMVLFYTTKLNYFNRIRSMENQLKLKESKVTNLTQEKAQLLQQNEAIQSR